jgi:hypothetical protein
VRAGAEFRSAEISRGRAKRDGAPRAPAAHGELEARRARSGHGRGAPRSAGTAAAGAAAARRRAAPPTLACFAAAGSGAACAAPLDSTSISLRFGGSGCGDAPALPDLGARVNGPRLFCRVLFTRVRAKRVRCLGQAREAVGSFDFGRHQAAAGRPRGAAAPRPPPPPGRTADCLTSARMVRERMSNGVMPDVARREDGQGGGSSRRAALRAAAGSTTSRAGGGVGGEVPAGGRRPHEKGRAHSAAAPEPQREAFSRGDRPPRLAPGPAPRAAAAAAAATRRRGRAPPAAPLSAPTPAPPTTRGSTPSGPRQSRAASPPPTPPWRRTRRSRWRRQSP